MTKEEKIKIAEECGLSYAEDNAVGDPEFIGTEKAWNRFTEKLDVELINESGRLVEADKVFGEE